MTLLFAIGAVLAFEGLLYALAPGMTRKIAERALQMDQQTLRFGGVCSLAFGVFLIWIAQG